MIPFIVFGVAAAVLALVFGLGWLIRRSIAAGEQRVAALVPEPRDRTRANCLGHSGPGAQVRGLGVLAFDQQRVVFAAGLRDRALTIPRAAITKATASSSFSRRGRAVRTAVPRVLTIDWETEAGTPATAGWQLPDRDAAEAWAKRLR